MIGKELKLANGETVTILSFDYWNSGGGNMIGRLRVFFHNEKVVRYILVDEEYIGMYAFDTIFDDVDMDSSDVMFDLVDYLEDETPKIEANIPVYAVALTLYFCHHARRYDDRFTMPTKYFSVDAIESVETDGKGVFGTQQMVKSKITILYDYL